MGEAARRKRLAVRNAHYGKEWLEDQRFLRGMVNEETCLVRGKGNILSIAGPFAYRLFRSPKTIAPRKGDRRVKGSHLCA